MTTKIELTSTERETLRQECGDAGRNVPVVIRPDLVIDGRQKAWAIRGEWGGWHTKGGTPIDHPSAYAKVGWSNMEYRRSTRRLLVSSDHALRICRPGQWAAVSISSPYNSDEH